MIINKKKIIIGITSIMLIFIMGISVSGQTLYGYSKSGTLNVTVKAWHTASHNTGPSPEFGARANAHMKRSYVRIIEGGYDSERVYSSISTSTSDTTTRTATKSKINNPLETMYTYYGWLYF